jgi:hypothetical protein
MNFVEVFHETAMIASLRWIVAKNDLALDAHSFATFCFFATRFTDASNFRKQFALQVALSQFLTSF